MYDIFFLSYDEPSANSNYTELKRRYPFAKNVNGIKGILKAHQECARQSLTNMFWVVDADTKIKPYFNFDYYPATWDLDKVHVWRSQIPINGLVYGYGAIKLLPKKLVLERDNMHSDMTTSLGTIKIVNILASETHFHTSAFNTWRSAFRECVKLASGTIKNQKDEESLARLETWCSVAFGEYANECLAGAKSGREYGIIHKNNIDELSKINDFDWLKEKYNELG